MEAITAQCAKHHFDRAVAVCGQCGLTFCPACLVYAFGPDKPPFCIPCALTAGGVRRAANVPKVSWREKRARKKLLDQQNAAVAEATLQHALANAMPEPEPEPEPVAPVVEEPVYEWSLPPVDAGREPVAPSADESMPPLEIDWSAPFDPSNPFERSSLAD
jgi:hypothetical protein